MLNYIILGSHIDYCEVMNKEVVDLENVYFENQRFSSNNKILWFLRRVHCSKKINNIVNLPFKKIWYSKYLDETKMAGKEENVFLIFDGNIHAHDKEYLDYLRKKYNGKIVLLLFNTIDSVKNHDPNRFNVIYDFIFTTDLGDSIKYGYHHIPMIFSKLESSDLENTSIKTDLFFVGANKDRIDSIHEIVDNLKKNNISYNFYVTNVLEEQKREDLDLKYNQRLTYKNVLENVITSNCLIEIVQKGQTGITLRTAEAIVYNKKLITNNSSIKKSSLYNPKYIKVFNSIDDIDIEFIKSLEGVDYGYKNEFSPLTIIKQIERVIENKKIYRTD